MNLIPRRFRALPMILAAFLPAALALAFGQTASAAAPVKPEIVIGENPPSLVREAAQELAGLLKRLYRSDATIVPGASEGTADRYFVGNPETNPAMQSWSSEWPSLSHQGHCLKSVLHKARPALLVGGGSPEATYWAVSEYAHSLGVRSMLYGDLDPVQAPDFRLSEYNVVLEPALKLRSWRTVNDFPIGPESWGLKEHETVIRQLAKLKYNRILISTYSWQPFVHYEFKGISKKTGVLWYGWRYPVSGDTAGRSVFQGAEYFDNPDFAGATTYAERSAAGEKLIHGICRLAHDHGMTVGLSLSPLEFPKEFAAALPGSQKVRGLEELTIGPGEQTPDDQVLMDLAKTQLNAWLKTYPEFDAVYLSMPEFPEWSRHAATSWKSLSERIPTADRPTLESLTESARGRTLTASGDRGVQAIRGNIVALDFLNRLCADKSAFHRPDGTLRDMTIIQPDPALFPWIDHLLPEQTGALHLVDYTARRVASHRELLKTVPTEKLANDLILTLADDNIGVLPQAAHGSIAGLLSDLIENKWHGFSTRYWCVGDLDLAAHLISRNSFGAGLTTQSAITDLIKPVCGDGVIDRVEKAMSYAEEATNLADQNDLGFSFPVPNMVIRHYLSDEEPPEWWSTVREHYLNAMNEMYRANTRAREGGRSYTLYHARRFEFGYEYMNCIEAVRKAGIAKRKGNQEEHGEQLQTAVDSINASLNALAAVARSNSDRGIIAVLNEYGYRPLMQELEALDEESAQ